MSGERVSEWLGWKPHMGTDEVKYSYKWSTLLASCGLDDSLSELRFPCVQRMWLRVG